jgi:hypothetical protein
MASGREARILLQVREIESALSGYTATLVDWVYAVHMGCIRLTNWDAAPLANIVQASTPAVLEEN